MKTEQDIMIENEAATLDSIVSLCCGRPQGDELPQVAGVEDILVDIRADLCSMPRECAAAIYHHQVADLSAFEDRIA